MKSSYIRHVIFSLLGTLFLACLLSACSTDDPEPGPTTYTVTFNSQGGSAVPAQTVEEGKPVPEPAKPAKSGNTFAGWYTETAYTTRWDFTNPVTKNLTLYAKWVAGDNPEPVPPTTYTVTFNSQGGSAVPAQTVEEGKPVPEPAKPAKSGNTFAGWYTETAYTTRWDFTNPVTKNLTLYAKWVAGDNVTLYTITFNTDGGSVIAPITDIAPGEIILVNLYQPTKTGYLFKGWHDITDTANPSSTSPGVTVTSDITLKALWYEVKTDNNLLGIWEGTETDSTAKRAYEFKEDGKGIYYLFGAKVDFTYVVSETEGLYIDGATTQYTISDSTLKVGNGNDAIEYSKVSAAPTGSGYGGDSRLHGTWKGPVPATGGGTITVTITFNPDGTFESDDGNGIWKAASDSCYMYRVNSIDDWSDAGTAYSISGSTLTLFNEITLTKQ